MRHMHLCQPSCSPILHHVLHSHESRRSSHLPVIIIINNNNNSNSNNSNHTSPSSSCQTCSSSQTLSSQTSSSQASVQTSARPSSSHHNASLYSHLPCRRSPLSLPRGRRRCPPSLHCLSGGEKGCCLYPRKRRPLLVLHGLCPGRPQSQRRLSHLRKTHRSHRPSLYLLTLQPSFP